MKELLKQKWFTIFAPYFTYIDQGKLFRQPFCWLYLLFAISNAIAPFGILFAAINNGAFDFGVKFVVAFILFWVVILAVCYFGVVYWIKRSIGVLEIANNKSEFVAIPVVSNLIQCFGEWFGTLFAVMGVFMAILTPIILDEQGRLFLSLLGFDSFGSGLIMIIKAPIIGFMIVVIARVAAEALRALATIANNTQK